MIYLGEWELGLIQHTGYHDVNFARVKAAKKYQAMCDEIFVVSDIKRAIDDPIIQDVVMDCCRRGTDVGKLTHPRLTVVCTHSGVCTCFNSSALLTSC